MDDSKKLLDPVGYVRELLSQYLIYDLIDVVLDFLERKILICKKMSFEEAMQLHREIVEKRLKREKELLDKQLSEDEAIIKATVNYGTLENKLNVIDVVQRIEKYVLKFADIILQRGPRGLLFERCNSELYGFYHVNSKDICDNMVDGFKIVASLDHLPFSPLLLQLMPGEIYSVRIVFEVCQ